ACRSACVTPLMSWEARRAGEISFVCHSLTRSPAPRPARGPHSGCAVCVFKFALSEPSPPAAGDVRTRRLLRSYAAFGGIMLSCRRSFENSTPVRGGGDCLGPCASRLEPTRDRRGPVHDCAGVRHSEDGLHTCVTG